MDAIGTLKMLAGQMELEHGEETSTIGRGGLDTGFAHSTTRK